MTPHPRTLADRLKSLFGRRRSPDVVVWVNTVDGQHAVPLSRLRKLR